MINENLTWKYHIQAVEAKIVIKIGIIAKEKCF